MENARLGADRKKEIGVRKKEFTGQGSSVRRDTEDGSLRTPRLESPLVCNNISSYCFDTSAPLLPVPPLPAATAFTTGYGFITRFLRHYVVVVRATFPTPTTRSIFPHFRPPHALCTLPDGSCKGIHHVSLPRIVLVFWFYFFRYCYELRLT